MRGPELCDWFIYYFQTGAMGQL